LERICAEVPRQGHLDSAGLAGAIRLLEEGRLALARGIPNAQGTYDYKQPGFFLPSDGHVRLSSRRSLAVPPPDHVRGRLSSWRCAPASLPEAGKLRVGITAATLAFGYPSPLSGWVWTLPGICVTISGITI
jgi:hypothetical protein